VNDQIGIVAVAFGPMGVSEACTRAAELGFDHVDAGVSGIEALSPEALAALAVPIGDRIGGFDMHADSTCMAPSERRGEDHFDRAVELFRRCPGARLEPGPRTAADSIEKVEALIAAVPGLQITLDTGHVAAWGEDPVRLLRLAGHVQLRQAAKGRPQLHPDEGGDVDFVAVIAELERLDYRGLLSVEYFDLPDYGWPLDDPVGHAVALAARVRPLLARR
jgi:sugar phosphate isomerase/epimerase